jgi:hypothetical protein
VRSPQDRHRGSNCAMAADLASRAGRGRSSKPAMARRVRSHQRVTFTVISTAFGTRSFGCPKTASDRARIRGAVPVTALGVNKPTRHGHCPRTPPGTPTPPPGPGTPAAPGPRSPYGPCSCRTRHRCPLAPDRSSPGPPFALDCSDPGVMLPRPASARNLSLETSEPAYGMKQCAGEPAKR